MRNILPEMLMGTWEDRINHKKYRFFKEEDKYMVTTINFLDKSTTNEFRVISEGKRPSQVELDKFFCDVWEVAENHIVLNKMGFVFKLDRIQ